MGRPPAAGPCEAPGLPAIRSSPPSASRSASPAVSCHSRRQSSSRAPPPSSRCPPSSDSSSPLSAAPEWFSRLSSSSASGLPPRGVSATLFSPASPPNPSAARASSASCSSAAARLSPSPFGRSDSHVPLVCFHSWPSGCSSLPRRASVSSSSSARRGDLRPFARHPLLVARLFLALQCLGAAAFSVQSRGRAALHATPVSPTSSFAAASFSARASFASLSPLASPWAQQSRDAPLPGFTRCDAFAFAFATSAASRLSASSLRARVSLSAARTASLRLCTVQRETRSPASPLCVVADGAPGSSSSAARLIGGCARGEPETSLCAAKRARSAGAESAFPSFGASDGAPERGDAPAPPAAEQSSGEAVAGGGGEDEGEAQVAEAAPVDEEDGEERAKAIVEAEKRLRPSKALGSVLSAESLEVQTLLNESNSGAGAQHAWEADYEDLEPSGPFQQAFLKAHYRKNFRMHEADCGSEAFQVASLTARINYLTQHLLLHRKDLSAVRGLRALVVRRRKHLQYLARTKPGVYYHLLRALNLKPVVVPGA
ncbi:ribosomal protein RPS15 [Besnoitia besnoiti]|uniref:Ribosomal protein RPS15 n=1 Tax=Besnoitia besnoiti TaxID=94643 RepID=A0A2A9M6N3_BESBE|nr:ribosomal protein RPS15 [Besnoitia besnoiti]PFH33645.1 ribosomal protein RPS15 [Besnoitia besnoiti]